MSPLHYIIRCRDGVDVWGVHHLPTSETPVYVLVMTYIGPQVTRKFSMQCNHSHQTWVKLALPQHSWYQDKLLSQWYTARVKKASLLPQCYPICPWDVLVECTSSILEGNDPPQVAQLIRRHIRTQTGHVQSQQHSNIRYERPSKSRDKKASLLFWNRVLQ